MVVCVGRWIMTCTHKKKKSPCIIQHPSSIIHHRAMLIRCHRTHTRRLQENYQGGGGPRQSHRPYSVAMGALELHRADFPSAIVRASPIIHHRSSIIDDQRKEEQRRMKQCSRQILSIPCIIQHPSSIIDHRAMLIRCHRTHTRRLQENYQGGAARGRAIDHTV